MRGFYINLDRRTDRRAEIEGELVGFDVERFPAIHNGSGIVGCGMSHIAVLKLARERGYPEVMIFEDDFQWIGDRVIPELPADYDVCMLAYNTQTPLADGTPWARGRNAQTTSGYIVHSRMYDRLIEVWEDGLQKLRTTGRHWDFALDQYWKQLQETHMWYCASPRKGKQRPSFSDLAGRFIDQGGV